MDAGIVFIGTAPPRVRERLENSFSNVHFTGEIDDLDGFLDEKGGSIEGLAAYGGHSVPDILMTKCPNLKIVSGYGVGYDHIDVATCLERDIMVTHTPNVLNAEVANTTIMLMLAVARRLVVDDQWVRSGNWAAKGNAPLRDTIEGKKVGILGLGRIGLEIASRLQTFNCQISYHTRNKRDGLDYRYYDDLAAMASDMDFLVVITPGGPATDKLVNKQVIEALGPEGTLINVARGTVVDEAALVEALQNGALGAAGLDVFEDEPNVPEALFPMENVVLLPHVGSATVQTRQAMGDLTVENLERFFAEGKVSTAVPECQHMAAAKA